MDANLVVTGAVTTSAVAIVLCLFSAAWMFVDVNNFYDATMKEMFEFKDLSNGAWTALTELTVPAKSSRSAQMLFNAIIRQKRSGYATKAGARACRGGRCAKPALGVGGYGAGGMNGGGGYAKGGGGLGNGGG
ncbi:unnamed protein product, partial [Cylicostephanus goldi]